MRSTTLGLLFLIFGSGCGDAAPNPDLGSPSGDAAHGGGLDAAVGAGDQAVAVGVDAAIGGGDFAVTPAMDFAVVTPSDLVVAPGADLVVAPGADLAGSSSDMNHASGFTTIVTILLENTSYSDIVGGANAPYLNSLINQYGLATNYSDSGSHPSLPNYLYMVSGATQYLGGFDVDPTNKIPGYNFPVDKENLGHQLTAAGIPWRAYMESMGTACRLTGTSDGLYAPKHNPFVYFTDIQTDPSCPKVDVDYSNFATDLAAGTYKYMWITPNMTSDGHDSDLATADKWCSQQIPKILGSATFKAGGALFITWDEGGGLFASDHVPMIVVSPRIKSKGFQSNTAFTHASYLATMEDLFKLPRLGAAAQATTLMEFFQ